MRGIASFADSLVHEWTATGDAMLSPDEWDALAPAAIYYNRLMLGYFLRARRKVEKRT
jgi:hypothetical protein